MESSMMTRNLRRGWQFKQTDTKEWLPVARVPTNVHLDLIDNHKIEDPFLGFNELKCEWVGEKSWTYRVTLPALESRTDDTKHVLAFDGLDTYANVKLNGEIILISDNMFITYRADVTEKLRRGGDSILEIEFQSALLESRKLKDADPKHKWVGWNGDMARLAVRKAQYHYGWDWGPVLMTCGPWRAIRLETYEARIAALHVDYEVSSSFDNLHGSITATIEGHTGTIVEFSATLGNNQVFKGAAEVDAAGHARVEFRINDPKLWSPHGYGVQTLYTITATLKNDEVILHSLSKRAGFRNCELVQRPDSIGKSFYFRINGVDIFCSGSNWIPADSFAPRITEARYRRWLEMVVNGNQVMLRVWGGGIWEEDVFYDMCDELGILVWQDFMFACGNYPVSPKFLESVIEEGVVQTQRLRHHPCMALYAGNNEDYQIQEQFGLTYDYKDKDPQNWFKGNFPARYYYEELLPGIVSGNSPQVPYHPGSPWGDGKATSDPTVGDMHQWNVWHGTQEKYQLYGSLGGRFNSEFGLEAFPHLETIKQFVTDPSQLYPQSQIMDFHNKAAGHERRIATYVVENFRMRSELDKFIHLSQLSQAEALTYAYRDWRRQWGQKRRCGGALVWQLNDCWPVISWSICDYFLLKKPAYYAMRRALAPVAVAVKREHHDWSVDHARPAKTSKYECWVSSSLIIDIKATVELRFVSIATGVDLRGAICKEDIKVAANGTTEVSQGVIDNTTDEPHIIAARLWRDGKIVSRDVDWPQPFKYLDFEDRGLEVKRHGDQLKIRAKKPVKGLVFEETANVQFSDNLLDVTPGDEQIIQTEGLDPDNDIPKWTSLDAP